MAKDDAAKKQMQARLRRWREELERHRERIAALERVLHEWEDDDETPLFSPTKRVAIIPEAAPVDPTWASEIRRLMADAKRAVTPAELRLALLSTEMGRKAEAEGKDVARTVYNKLYIMSKRGYVEKAEGGGWALTERGRKEATIND